MLLYNNRNNVGRDTMQWTFQTSYFSFLTTLKWGMQHLAYGCTASNWQLNWRLSVSKTELNRLLSLAMARNKPALKELNEIMQNNLQAHASGKVGAGPAKTKIPSGLTFFALWGFNPLKCDSGTVRIWLKGLRDAAKTATVREVVGTQLLQCLFHAGKSTWPGFSDIF